MMVPVFWTICIPFSSHPLFLHTVCLQVMTEITDDVPYTVQMNETQETVCTTIHAGDMKVLSVAYVSGFIASHLLLMAAVKLAGPV
jgi:hypothetical protein